ncbi:MAG: hypothetical protein ACU84H_00490 [Gammaproteobacteria bacterium]
MSHNAFFVRIKWIIVVLLIMILDTLPIPIMGLVILFVLIFRPLWFRDVVLEIYDIKRDFNANDINWRD